MRALARVYMCNKTRILTLPYENRRGLERKKMSICSFLPSTVLFMILMTLSPPQESVEAARIGAFLSSFPGTWMQSFPESRDLTATSLPPLFRERRFGWREAKACLPKGPVHSSAPSRFVNYQPLRSTANRCSSPSLQPSPEPSVH